ncbi:MAG: zinc ribbon domain-containing protein [Ilumatobacteraceae bacterium]
MPLYEYRCRTCDTDFELRRAMTEAGAPAECPHGHIDSMRRLSMFASVGSSAGPAPSAGGGGACCGGGCGCHR